MITINKPSARLTALLKSFNPYSRNNKDEKHIPVFPGSAQGGANSPQLGLVAPVLNVPAASGQSGPVFAVGAQGAFGLQAVDVVLTSAQILALQTGAVTLIAAPPAGWHLVPRFIKMILLAGSAAYTDAGGAVSFNVGSLTVAMASNAIFLVTTSPNRRIQWLDPIAAAAGTGITGTAGNPPTEDGAALTISKATNNFAAGNGTMKLTIYFTVEPTL